MTNHDITILKQQIQTIRKPIQNTMENNTKTTKTTITKQKKTINKTN